jgi:hypothetical protein
LRLVAEKLAEKSVYGGTSQVVKWLISKLTLEQEAHEIGDFLIELPDKTIIHGDPPGESAVGEGHFDALGLGGSDAPVDREGLP